MVVAPHALALLNPRSYSSGGIGRGTGIGGFGNGGLGNGRFGNGVFSTGKTSSVADTLTHAPTVAEMIGVSTVATGLVVMVNVGLV